MNSEELNQIKTEDQKLPYSDKLEDNLKFIRERITELRLSENISERSLGDDIGKGKSYIQQVTSGKILPTLIPLLQLCERFGVEPKEFFDPDFHNPTLLHEATECIKKLDEDELKLVIQLLNKLNK